MEVSYAMVYKEVLEMIKRLPETEYNKIPKEKIMFYENNCDNSYNFIPRNDLSNVSQRANAIMISIYKNYFTTPTQQEKLKKLLDNNSQIVEEQKREKYNPDNLFKSNKQEELIIENTQMIEYKKTNLFIKLINKVKRFLEKMKKDF